MKLINWIRLKLFLYRITRITSSMETITDTLHEIVLMSKSKHELTLFLSIFNDLGNNLSLDHKVVDCHYAKEYQTKTKTLLKHADQAHKSMSRLKKNLLLLNIHDKEVHANLDTMSEKVAKIQLKARDVIY